MNPLTRSLPMLMLPMALVTIGAHAVAADDSAPEPAAGKHEWKFEALLDGKPIGEHRFTVVTRGDERSVTSDARFDVTFLGFNAYRYRHKATEQWRGNCLADIATTTDDNGKPLAVKGDRSGEALQLKTPSGNESLPGCVMSYAYWNPAIRNQTHLLNAQTGKLDPVRISRAGKVAIEVHGKKVEAEQWRIAGPEAPIDLLLSPEGDWIGLDSTVSGNRRLTYRLQ